MEEVIHVCMHGKELRGFAYSASLYLLTHASLPEQIQCKITVHITELVRRNHMLRHLTAHFGIRSLYEVSYKNNAVLSYSTQVKAQAMACPVLSVADRT